MPLSERWRQPAAVRAVLPICACSRSKVHATRRMNFHSSAVCWSRLIRIPIADCADLVVVPISRANGRYSKRIRVDQVGTITTVDADRHVV
jgi:hypothetical protein